MIANYVDIKVNDVSFACYAHGVKIVNKLNSSISTWNKKFFKVFQYSIVLNFFNLFYKGIVVQLIMLLHSNKYIYSQSHRRPITRFFFDFLHIFTGKLVFTYI